jgi:hypothetical protein
MRFGAATLTLTLALGLGVVGMASAQESGNWFTRLLSPAEKVDPDKLADKADAPKIPPAVNRTALKAAKKAKADWERRVDVCDKLRRIAEETEDEDLRRKVDRLEQRAWDIYLAAKNAATELEGPPPEPDAKKGARK